MTFDLSPLDIPSDIIGSIFKKGDIEQTDDEAEESSD